MCVIWEELNFYIYETAILLTARVITFKGPVVAKIVLISQTKAII